MAAFITSQALGQRICKALDIDPSKVRRLTIDCDRSRAASVLISYIVDDNEADAIAEALTDYQLVERETL